MMEMEYSSPLAAMHPQCPPWGNRRDLPASRSMYSQAPFSANSFNFKDLSMKRSQSDYFTLRPASRGSSPTASLAADLSSNFHIDQSPQIPTPRRSLFNQNLPLPRARQDQLATPPVDYEESTTPPIVSSSPCIDMMDASPLPHKQPCFVARVTLPSPSPEASPDEDDMVESEDGLSIPEAPVHEHRKKPALLRPSLIRTKGYSTTSVPHNSQSDSQLPAFRFGNGVQQQLGASASCTNLDECFESPSHDRKALSINLMGPPPRRTSLGTRCNGSPNAHVKKQLAPVRAPPRKQVRRSLSMFQHPDDVMKDHSQDYQPMPTISMELDEEYKHKLPHFIPDDEPDSLPRIQQDTLLNILDGTYNTHYEKILIVDCRFEYEFNGGHINGAENYNNKEELAEKLFEDGLGAEMGSNTLLVFHCEYSELRAPRMAKFVRNRDRAVNDFQYPKLSYPEMYILDGGYSKFFANHRTKCYPQNYVEMQDKDHEHECEKGLGKLKQRAKLSRAVTFAFGQNSCQMEDSPTAGSRMGQRSMSAFDVSPHGSDYNSPLGHSLARRLAY